MAKARKHVDYKLDPRNARKHPAKNQEAAERSLDELGAGRSVLSDRDGVMIGGNLIYEKAKALGMPTREVEADGSELIVVRRTDLGTDDPKRKALALADNQITLLGVWDEIVLEEIKDEIEDIVDLGVAGFAAEDFHQEAHSLSSRFVVPPVSILDARQGYWQERRREWLDQGIRSEIGRGNDGDKNESGLTFKASAQPIAVYNAKNDYETKIGRKVTWEEFTTTFPNVAKQAGTSTFDPVLTEIMVRWFCPPGGMVLDPFAGGSVRGIVAGLVGRGYTGVDLSTRQVEENRAQALEIIGEAKEEGTTNDPDALTPVEKYGEYYLKRDDLFEYAGVRGGKVRTCLALSKDAVGLVTAGSRMSPQVNIVAHIAKQMGIPCHVHTPEGELSPEVSDAKTFGAEVIQHKAGYNNVIIKRARDDAEKRGWTEIPFGMGCEEAVNQTKRQVRNVPNTVVRIVVPVGSGMSLSGILWGLKEAENDTPVLGVRVGADPIKRLDKYAPSDWRDRVTLVTSSHDYHDEVSASIGDVTLDPIYEAKCADFLEAGDLLWIVGVRRTAAVAGHPRWIVGDSRKISEVDVEADFVFTCPPYGDLEIYSDDPADLCNLPYEDFRRDFAQIIKDTVAHLKDDRFAAVVIGEIRDKKTGLYRALVPDTVRAFMDAGLSFYNEMAYITPYGSLAVRAARPFMKSRKIGKTHQNVLIFVKGDPKAATEAVGRVEVGDPADLAAEKAG